MRAAQTVTTMNDDAMMDMHVSQIGADGTPSNMWLFRGSLPTEIYSFSDMHGTADGQLALAFNFKGENMTLSDGTVLRNSVPSTTREQSPAVATRGTSSRALAM